MKSSLLFSASLLIAGIAPGLALGQAKPQQAKALLLEKSDDWSAYTAPSGKDKLCYALTQPKDRQPSGLTRDPAYLYVWMDPSKNIRSEISVILGFPAKDGSDATGTIGSANFAFSTKDGNAWLKNPAEGARFVDAMRKGEKLVMKVTSKRGNNLTDSYSLAGIANAVARAAKECQ
jgi:invasion protein IalB